MIGDRDVEVWGGELFAEFDGVFGEVGVVVGGEIGG